jgi:hypothetical protein
MPPALPHLRIWFFYLTMGDVSYRDVNSVARGLMERAPNSWEFRTIALSLTQRKRSLSHFLGISARRSREIYGSGERVRILFLAREKRKNYRYEISSLHLQFSWATRNVNSHSYRNYNTERTSSLGNPTSFLKKHERNGRKGRSRGCVDTVKQWR